MPPDTLPSLDALTFDLEDWFHLLDVPGLEDPQQWPAFTSLVERITEPLLDLLECHQAKATFFILGWIATRHPRLIRRIAEAGHEIACHGHWHRRLNLLTAKDFRAELQLAITEITGAAGIRPRGFRAPGFSITPGSEWILDELLDQGFTYDASLFPAHRDNGGYPCPRGPHVIKTPTGRHLPELPMSVMHLGPWTTVFSGGGFLRLFPLPIIHRGFRQCHHEGRPAVVYLHPRDFAPDGPKFPMPMFKRFKARVGLHTTQGKLETLLTNYQFAPCEEVLFQSGLLKRGPDSDVWPPLGNLRF